MLDSDDCLKPGSLGDAMTFLKAQRPDMLLTRLLEIRDPRKMTSDWQGFNPVPLPRNEAVARFLRHKDFQAHLIGQFIHRSLYESNPIPPMLCYEDFAVFPRNADAIEQNSLSTPGALLLHQASRQFVEHSGRQQNFNACRMHVTDGKNISVKLQASRQLPLV